MGILTGSIRDKVELTIHNSQLFFSREERTGGRRRLKYGNEIRDRPELLNPGSDICFVNEYLL